MAKGSDQKRTWRKRGFQRTGTLVESRVRKCGESRGFAVSKLLTHWPDVVGEQLAGICRPVEISYGRSGFGGTLVLLTTGAQAPMLEMQAEQIRDKVNAIYGYAAISRVRITQTAASGFAEGRADFSHAPRNKPEPPAPDPKITAQAASEASAITDPGLRAAIEQLGGKVLAASTPHPKKGHQS